jgi:hypothetical protein
MEGPLAVWGLPELLTFSDPQIVGTISSSPAQAVCHWRWARRLPFFILLGGGVRGGVSRSGQLK